MLSDKDKERLCGDIITEFASAPSIKEGWEILIRGFQKLFVFSQHFIESQFAEYINSQKSEFNLSHHKYHLSHLRSILDDIINKRNLNETEEFGRYLFLNRYATKSKLKLNSDGSLIEKPLFSEKKFKSQDYDLALGFCLINFLKSTKYRQRTYKCKNCEKYFIAERKRKEGQGPYCETKCKNAWHNRENIRSGKAAAYKRKGYWEGKYQ